jgi:hypothetical protein
MTMDKQLTTLTKWCVYYRIDSEHELDMFYDMFLSNELMNELRRMLKDQEPKDRPECADAFRKYQRFALDKYNKAKKELNVL